MTFDSLASRYDSDFTQRPIARWLRSRVHARLDAHFDAERYALELGCGTGEDAIYLAARGVQVMATDASPAMLETARAKLVHHNRERNALIKFRPLDLNALPDEGFEGPFDGVYANFGVLNCVHDRGTLAAWLAERVKPGGILGFAVMSPTCLWEIGWYAAHLKLKKAVRRFRPAQFKTSDGIISIQYPPPRTLKREFAPWFTAVRLQPLGLFLPPSEIFAVVEKRPDLLKRLTALDTRTANTALFARFADHYWIEFTRIKR